MSRNNPETLALAMDYQSAMEAATAYVTVRKPALREPSDVYAFIRPLLTAASGGDKQEVFMAVLLDTKNRVIEAPVICTMGLLDSSPVHPREVFRAAVVEGAASVILVHNHPSGDPTPSKEDCDITRRLVKASKILGIRVADHVVCGRPSDVNPSGYVSLREKNLVAFN